MNNLLLINCDTDSTMVAKPDGSPWTKEEQEKFLEALNKQFPEKIKFEHDGVFTSVVVFGSKNYALLPEGKDKIKTKGSAIRDQKKEPAMREMMDKVIEAMIYDKQDEILNIYHRYVKEALNVKDINRWCSKKTVTEAVTDCANPKNESRKQELDIWNAIREVPGVQMGDKFYLYPVILHTVTIPGGVSAKTGKPLKDKTKEITGLKRNDQWTGDQDVERLVGRCYDTLSIFESVLDMDKFLDYTLKRNKTLLEGLK